MASIINSTTTSPGGLISTGDSSNSLLIQTGDTTAITVSSSQVVTLANALSVSSGGTGATTLTANNVLLGNGTSALQAVAPGTSGNVLTSNGTTWTSSAPAGGPNPLHGSPVFTSSGTFNVPTGVTAVKVTVIGAGGNGAGRGYDGCSYYSGGGGGAGGWVVDYVTVTPGGTATVTVGTNAGTRTSSFAGGTTLTASGGSNGTNSSSSTGTVGASGGISLFGLTGYSTSLTNNASGISGSGFTSAGNTTTSGQCYEHNYGTGGGNPSTPSGYGGGGGGQPFGGSPSASVGANGLVVVEW